MSEQQPVETAEAQPIEMSDTQPADAAEPEAAELLAPTVVAVNGVSKRFVMRKDNSLKERLVTLGRMGRKHRQDFWALTHVDLDIKAGSTVGLIGHNGSGKSTLLKVIGGIIDPTTGTVALRGRLAALLELGAGFHPDLTGRENVFLNASVLGLSRQETEERFDDILAFSGIGEFIDTQVKFYSSGMYVRLAFAVAVHTDPDILLVDEVLAVGDEIFQRKCLDKIHEFQQEGRTIVLVTHSMAQVAELCDRVIVLDRGAVMHDGDPSDGIATMRTLLEERARSQEPAKDLAPRGTVSEVSIRVIGRDGASTVRPGDSIVIRMVCEHQEVLSEFSCGIQISNAMDQVACSTTSTMLGARLGPLEGSKAVEFTLQDVQFGAGKYSVTASLMDKTGEHINDVPGAVRFTVPFDAHAAGIVHVTPSVRTVSAG